MLFLCEFNLTCDILQLQFTTVFQDQQIIDAQFELEIVKFALKYYYINTKILFELNMAFFPYLYYIILKLILKTINKKKAIIV